MVINNKYIERAIEIYVITLSTGKVKPRKFYCTLNEQIFYLLEYMVDIKLSKYIA
jgi:hypothetical protein